MYYIIRKSQLKNHPLPFECVCPAVGYEPIAFPTKKAAWQYVRQHMSEQAIKDQNVRVITYEQGLALTIAALS